MTKGWENKKEDEVDEFRAEAEKEEKRFRDKETNDLRRCIHKQEALKMDRNGVTSDRLIWDGAEDNKCNLSLKVCCEKCPNVALMCCYNTCCGCMHHTREPTEEFARELRQVESDLIRSYLRRDDRRTRHLPEMEEGKIDEVGVVTQRVLDNAKMITTTVFYVDIIAMFFMVLTCCLYLGAKNSGLYHIVPSNCDDATYSSGNFPPAALQNYQYTSFGSEIAPNKDWYIGEWQLRSPQGLCPLKLWDDKMKIINAQEQNPDDDPKLYNYGNYWDGCYRLNTDRALLSMVTADEVNDSQYATKSDFVSGWEQFGTLINQLNGSAVFCGVTALGLFSFFFILKVIYAMKAFTGHIDQRQDVSMWVLAKLLFALLFLLFTMFYLDSINQIESFPNVDNWEPFFPTCTMTVTKSASYNCLISAMFFSSVAMFLSGISGIYQLKYVEDLALWRYANGKEIRINGYDVFRDYHGNRLWHKVFPPKNYKPVYDGEGKEIEYNQA